MLETIGVENIDASLKVIKQSGRLISIPSGLSETVTEKAKAKSVNGFFFHVQSNSEHMEQIAQLLESGIIRPYISKVYDFSEMAVAHLQQEAGCTHGKLIVTIHS